MKRYASYKASGVAWLGDVPSHWRIEKVKFQAHLRGEKTVGTNGARYVGMEHVLPKVGKFNPVVDGTQEEAESTVNVFSKGDVLFGKLRPYLAKCVVADTDGVCSSEFLVLSPADDVVPAYLNATMLMQEFIDAVDASTYGAKMPRADWEFIGQQRLPLPPPDEQQAIADYLDTETARIDDLIREKEELIGLLREWRQSVIAEAVTKGLDKTAAMKPSGVPWLGDIPSHWDAVGMTKKIASIVDYRGKTPEKVDQGVFLVTAKNIREGFIDYDVSQEFVSVDDYEEVMRRGKPDIGDVLFTTEAPLGNVALVNRTDIALAQRVIKFKGIPQTLDNSFLMYWLLSRYMQEQLSSWSSGSTAEGIKSGRLVRLPLALPPFNEQQAIADYLDDETAKIDALITHTQEEIALLKELRAATIADAVLGRVDVRECQK